MDHLSAIQQLTDSCGSTFKVLLEAMPPTNKSSPQASFRSFVEQAHALFCGLGSGDEPNCFAEGDLAELHSLLRRAVELVKGNKKIRTGSEVAKELDGVQQDIHKSVERLQSSAETQSILSSLQMYMEEEEKKEQAFKEIEVFLNRLRVKSQERQAQMRRDRRVVSYPEGWWKELDQKLDQKSD
ncbi:hypothetical protein BDV12DRAFT_201880 [Aspergillus spectabilis]